MLDEDGYPTDEALALIENFEGSPAQMVDLIQKMWSNYGGARLEDITDDFERPAKRLSLVTGGWSGNESVQGALEGTLFHFAFWHESKRGGLTVYEVGPHTWDSTGQWGTAALRGAQDEGVAERVRAAQEQAWDAGYYRGVRDNEADTQPADNPYRGTPIGEPKTD